MPAYFDTGTLVPLYVKEDFSPAIKSLVDGRHKFVSIHMFHRLELENALRLKVFRGEMTADLCREVFAGIRTDIDDGRVVLRSVDWINAFEQARGISESVVSRVGCRTLDLLHVAIAVQWKCDVFVTADDRQLKAARVAGLRTVDVRTIPSEYPSGGGSSAGLTNTVRERLTRYGTRGQKSVRRRARTRKGSAK